MKPCHTKFKDAIITDTKEICSKARLKQRYEALAVQLKELETLNKQVLLVQRICGTPLQQDRVQLPLYPAIRNEHSICKFAGK